MNIGVNRRSWWRFKPSDVLEEFHLTQHRCDNLKSLTVIIFYWCSFPFDLIRFVDNPPQACVSVRATSVEHHLYPPHPKKDKNISSFQTEALFLQAIRVGWEKSINWGLFLFFPCFFFCKNSKVHPPTIPGRHVVFCSFESFVVDRWTSTAHKNIEKSWNQGSLLGTVVFNKQTREWAQIMYFVFI